MYPRASLSCQVVVVLAVGMCFHLHCGRWFAPSASANHLLVELPYRGGQGIDWSEGRSFPYLTAVSMHIYIYIYLIFTAAIRTCLNMRVLRVGGVMSPRSLAISYSVSDIEGLKKNQNAPRPSELVLSELLFLGRSRSIWCFF